MSHNTANACYPVGKYQVYRHEIAGELFADGFRFAAQEKHWSTQTMAHIYSKVVGAYEHLSDRDCTAYAKIVNKYQDDVPQLIKHLKTLTYRLLKKWHAV